MCQKANPTVGISDFEMAGLGTLKNGWCDAVLVGCLEGTLHFPLGRKRGRFYF